jgi:hypothetical protein
MCRDKSIKIFVDNNSTIILGKKTQFFYKRNEHANSRYPFIRECIRKKEVWLGYVKFINQVAYILTRVLKWEDFCKLKALLRLI